MAIGGIGSFETSSYYGYQAAVSRVKTKNVQSVYTGDRQAVESVHPVNRASMTEGSSSMDFIKSYGSAMAGLMQSSNTLRQSNRSGVLNDLEVTSSDISVAEASKRYEVRNSRKIEVEVAQMASAQVNKSAEVLSAAPGESDMKLVLSDSQGRTVRIEADRTYEDGSFKTNLQMMEEAKARINSQSDVGVKAYIEEKDGVSALRIEGNKTGRDNGFLVTGDPGPAAGLEKALESAKNAVYSVTDKGNTVKREASENEAAIDNGRIGLKFLDTGKVTISARVNEEKVAAAAEDLTESYNNALKLLKDHVNRGSAVAEQLESLTGQLAFRQPLEQLGMREKEDGSLELDKDVLRKNLRESPELTADLLGGGDSVAQSGYQAASKAMGTSALGLIGNDLKDEPNELQSDPYNFMNVYSRTGAYNMNNYNALGLMINYLV
ncbi:hypothetical protein AALB39_24360 [Lachnospiraceae bacterium 54-53]